MTPTNLPLQPSTPAAAAAGPAQTAGEQTQTADFLLMLGQLVAASVQRSGTSAAMPTSKIPSMVLDGASKKEATSPEEMLAMFSMAIPPQPQMLPLQPLPAGMNPAAEQSLSALPDVLAGVNADNARQGMLQEVAQQVVDSKLLTDVAVEELSPDVQIPDSLQASTAPFQLQQTQPAHAPHSQAALDRPIHSPVGSRTWADEVGTRVVMMTESGNHTASLKLSPDHLGPLEINITVRDDKASVWFGAAHADTRAAIETALPRLREMFESQGLSLADAGVFREPPREQPAVVKSNPVSGEQGEATSEVASVSSRVQLGLVDAYA